MSGLVTCGTCGEKVMHCYFCGTPMKHMAKYYKTEGGGIWLAKYDCKGCGATAIFEHYVEED